MLARRERVRRRLLIALALAGALALSLAAALAPASAQAGCSICGEYTLDMPDAGVGDGGTFDSGGADTSSGSAPAPTPAPTTTTPAPTAPATTTVPETTTPTTTAEPAGAGPDEERAEPTEPFVPVRVDGPPDSGQGLASKPLHYEGEDSAAGAALAGLESPGTIALLAALIAAGAAVAVGRRRSPAA
jgi:hypothetical protein